MSSNQQQQDLPIPLTHGYLLKDRKDLPLPTCSSKHNDLSRPDMKNNTGITKSEFRDSFEVMLVKADLFIEMCHKSKALGILAGAGLSVSSGINDYASAGQASNQRLTKDFTESLRPTPAHRVIAEMVRTGHMHLFDTLQQNHDGLLNLAGLPADKINEMHGAWKDSINNPVIKMNGSLQTHRFERMLELEKNQDMGFAIGTSLSGLNADRILATPCKRAQNPQKYGNNQLGGIILSLQQTPYDKEAALRIFGTTDDFMMLVAYRLGLTIDFDTDYNYHTGQPYKVPVNRRAPSTIAAIQKLKEWDIYFGKNKPQQQEQNGAAVATTTTSNVVPATAADSNTRSIVVQQQVISKKTVAPVVDSFDVTVGNYHNLESDSNDNNKHRWTMFVRSSKPNVIKSVVFHLHPSFSPSSVKVTSASPDANNKYPNSQEFVLTRLGWGTFEVGVEIELMNSKKVECKHMIRFDQGESGVVVYKNE